MSAYWSIGENTMEVRLRPGGCTESAAAMSSLGLSVILYQGGKLEFASNKIEDSKTVVDYVLNHLPADVVNPQQ
jgi:hypothetical protein